MPTGKRFDVLNLRQPFSEREHQRVVRLRAHQGPDAAFGYSQNNNSRSNQGIGFYDLPERAFKSDQQPVSVSRARSRPDRRRTFINTRMTMAWMDFGNQSSVEAPTIIVQDAFTSGGAQQSGRVHGKKLTFASDVDYVRGITRGGAASRSTRTGIAPI
jgi:hypothetical protein